MSPERDLTEELGDASMGNMAPSLLPVMMTWVSLGIALETMHAVRWAEHSSHLLFHYCGFSQRTRCHPNGLFQALGC